MQQLLIILNCFEIILTFFICFSQYGASRNKKLKYLSKERKKKHLTKAKEKKSIALSVIPIAKQTISPSFTCHSGFSFHAAHLQMSHWAWLNACEFLNPKSLLSFSVCKSPFSFLFGCFFRHIGLKKCLKREECQISGDSICWYWACFCRYLNEFELFLYTDLSLRGKVLVSFLLVRYIFSRSLYKRTSCDAHIHFWLRNSTFAQSAVTQMMMASLFSLGLVKVSFSYLATITSGLLIREKI